MDQKGTQNDQHGAKREPKLAKEPSKTQLAEQGWQNDEKGGLRVLSVEAFFDQNR